VVEVVDVVDVAAKAPAVSRTIAVTAPAVAKARSAFRVIAVLSLEDVPLRFDQAQVRESVNVG
jgi:hypothetical protein